MAFTNTFQKVSLMNGFILEHGTWDGTAVTTGTITADTTVQPEILDIVAWGASSNADTAVDCAMDAGANKLKLTFSSGDAGHYYIVGKGK